MISAVEYSVTDVLNDYKRGYTVTEIANRYVTTSKVINKILEDNGVKVRGAKASSAEFTNSVLVEFTEGKTIKEISSLLQSSEENVRKVLKKKKYDVEIKMTKEQSDNLVQEDYQRIHEFIEKGYSVEQIAEMYNLDRKRSVKVYTQAAKLSNTPKKPKTSNKKINVLSDEEKELIKKLLNDGRSKNSIAKETGRSYNTVEKIAKEMGLVSNTSKPKSTSKTSKTSKKRSITNTNRNEFFSSYEEKKKYLDDHYGVGHWKILTRREIYKLWFAEEEDYSDDILEDKGINMSLLEASKTGAYDNMYIDI